MLQFYEKRTLRGFLSSPLALIILGLICAFMVTVVYERYTINEDMIAKQMEADKHLQDLETRKADLDKKVQYLSNDRGIEAEMRKNFDVARPGEQVVIIVDPEKKPEIKPLDATSTPEKPWYKFW
jgi:cell division protein FtsB